MAGENEVKAIIGAIGVRYGDHKKQNRCNDCKRLHGILPEIYQPTPGTIAETVSKRANGALEADAALPAAKPLSKILSFCTQNRQDAALSGVAYFCILPIP